MRHRRSNLHRRSQLQRSNPAYSPLFLFIIFIVFFVSTPQNPTFWITIGESIETHFAGAMDLQPPSVYSVNRGVFCSQIGSFSPKHSWFERQIPCSFGRIGAFRVVNGRVFEIGVSKRPSFLSSHRSMVVNATGKKNHDSSSSSSGGSDHSVPEEIVRKEAILLLTASLMFRTGEVSEQIQLQQADSSSREGVPLETTRPLDLKWAHSISEPEAGCVLVATEKLDGVRTFERTVVFLLRSGTNNPREGPFGVVINRPLHKKIKHMKPTNLDLATTFADCSLYFGGPLEASMFLLNAGQNPRFPGFEQVIPGLYFGARNSLDEAAALVKKGAINPQDFRFFVGYAGWQLDQLREEIESDYWYVAACSSNLITGASTGSSSGLWEEILQLMGGHYSELSRKPKQDN
ncbi:hypothetical protein Sjap_021361 [Stephania japonica]|uniref:Uncharacterized protein n=1 Tax=Stephania japonica TaxID=461633 RepID=A0AAP0HRG1_9MAGN